MQTLLEHDMLFIRRRMPEPVVKLMKANPDRAVIAGGFIRSIISSEPIHDIDMFAPSKDDAKAWAFEFAMRNQSKVHETQNAYTVLGFKPTLQIIHRWTYEKPEDIVSSFDFTIACSSIWWKKEPLPEHPNRCVWASLIHDRFYADLAAKRLVYLSPERNEDAGGSLLRVLKFSQRGYRMPLDSMAAVIARLLRGVKEDNGLFWDGKNKDGNRPPEAEVERYRSKILTGLLREVDPNFDPDHIAHLPASEQPIEGEGDEV